MERQTKHRILAIFVVIGLVVILLPLFQSDKDITTGATMVDAPPFPDQVQQIDSDTDNDHSAVDNVSQFKNPPKAQYQHNAKTPRGQSGQGVVTVHTDDYRAPGGDGKASTEQVVDQAVKPDAADQVMMLDEPQYEKMQRSQQIFRNGGKKIPQTDKMTVKLSHTKNSVKKAIYHPDATKKKGKNAKDVDELFKLQNPVWVIQVGSFKRKPNAQKLVNKLRKKGYPAFMQQVLKKTRVYVGPKKVKQAARETAVQIHSDLKIKGIVVSYKPLKI